MSEALPNRFIQVSLCSKSTHILWLSQITGSQTAEVGSYMGVWGDDSVNKVLTAMPEHLKSHPATHVEGELGVTSLCNPNAGVELGYKQTDLGCSPASQLTEPVNEP